MRRQSRINSDPYSETYREVAKLILAERDPYARAHKVEVALAHLREARNLLKEAEAPKALARTRLAISSTEGAVRHAYHDPHRQARQEREAAAPFKWAEPEAEA